MRRLAFAFVAGAFYVVVRGEDVGLLLGDELVNGEGEFLGEGVFVGLFGLVFPLLCCLEKGMIAAAELCLEIAPDAVDGAGGASRFLDVVLALAVELVLEFGPEVGALEGFGEEEAFEGLILEVLADVGEAPLAVLQGIDEGVEHTLDFVLLGGIGGHRSSYISGMGVEAGSTGCQRFSFAGGKREKSLKSRSPAIELLRSAGLAHQRRVYR